MRPAPGRGTRVAVLGALVAAVAVVGAAFGTWSAFTDTDPGASGTTGAATVVLGGRSAPPTLTFSGLRAGTTTTLPLTVDYRGSIPATVALQFPSTTATSCTRSGLALLDGAQVGSLTVTLGARSAESWCGLLDGAPRTVLASVAPGTQTTVPVTVTVGSAVLAARAEQAVLRITSAGGFTDQVAGTIRITTGLAPGVRAAARVASPTVVAAPAAPPAECVAAGLTRFAETVTLSPATPSFDAARDRPGSPGPFLVIGTAAADTVVGSGAGDCVAGAGGGDVVDGAGGDDVVLGGDGDDRLTGGNGADRLFGGPGADTLVGGPGADALDGGTDGGSCPDAAAEDTVTACTTPVGTAPPAVPPGPVQEGAPDPTTAAATPEPTTTPSAEPGDPATASAPG